MLERGVNTVNTSSCGRLFDAVASFVGLRHEVNFEGQAAIELEIAARKDVEERYPFQIESSEPWQIDVRPMIEAIVHDVNTGIDVGLVSARFHNALASIISEVCCRLRRQEKLERVCLSGGTFQNMFLLERTVAALTGDGFKVFLHAAVPPNDGGISLGQAVIANAAAQAG
jgi:hydrogenase maturation protein HypF